MLVKTTLILLFSAFLFLVSCRRPQTAYYENGQPEYEIEVRNGKYHGEAVWYFPNGKVKQTCVYADNKLNGKLVRYHSNGKPQLEEFYSMGLRNGESISYYITGKRESLKTYRNDTLNGPYKAYHIHGEKKVEGNYSDGLFSGRWLYYDIDGAVIGIGEFSEGSGKHRAWYKNGQLQREVGYRNNKKNGEEKWWRMDGSLEKVIIYNEGEVEKTITY